MYVKTVFAILMASTALSASVNAAEVRVVLPEADVEAVSSNSSPTASTGEDFRGGICAEPGGCDGSNDLVVSSSRDASDAYWGTYLHSTEARSNTDGSGNTTTAYNDITADKGSRNPAGGYTPNAVVTCVNKTANGYSDWYLPAIDQLQTIEQELYQSPTDYGFESTWYASSTEKGSTLIWSQEFGVGQTDFNKGNNNLDVRCTRTAN